MNLPRLARSWLRPLTPFLLALSVGSGLAPAAPTDRKFEPEQSLSIEIPTFIRLLEEVHYNRDAVTRDDYQKIIPDYMGSLDNLRMFFLQSDLDAFKQRYGDNLYFNIYNLRRVDPAFEIFRTYEQRVGERVTWIFAQLDAGLSVEGTGTFELEREKGPWPADAATADDLWLRRLRLDLIQEVLNKKTPEEARTTIRKRYERMLKNVADIDANDLSELFLSTLARLYDPHSTYFSADTYEDFGIQMKLQLVGIGALLGIEEDTCVIKEIIPGGPAALSGLIKPDDKILAVGQDDEEPVDIIGMKLRKVVDLIRGKKGTRVHLVIQPADATDSATRRDVVLARNVVKLESQRAHASIHEVPKADGSGIDSIGVITLPAFYGGEDENEGKRISATADVAELLQQLKTQNIQGLVLDLRGNGGGLLTEAIALTGLFIDQGPVVQVRSYYGDVKVDGDSDAEIGYSGPLAVLVSKFSASASEIVAGALQNYGRALIIGDSATHGKGTVQTVVEMRTIVPQLARLGKSGAAKLTIQKFYLPSGSSTQLNGVVPDIVLPSVDDLLPVGERDLPHALVWDEIPTSKFEGQPLAAEVLDPLRAASRARQENLEEFVYLHRHIEWFKERQARKAVSLNLDERRAEKAADEIFRKELKTERERLAQSDFAFREIRLVPAPQKNIKSAADDDDIEATGETLSDSVDEADTSKVDIQLRESLRVIADAIALGQKPEHWAAQNRLPLSAPRGKSG